jgi:hypothetical protein
MMLGYLFQDASEKREGLLKPFFVRKRTQNIHLFELLLLHCSRAGLIQDSASDRHTMFTSDVQDLRVTEE